MRGFIAMYVLIGVSVGIGTAASDLATEAPGGLPIVSGIAWPLIISIVVADSANESQKRKDARTNDHP